MRFILLVCALAFASFGSLAVPGDTTVVQAHHNKELRHSHTSWYGNYDTAVSFPSGTTSYRRIIMTFTLGKYPCPGYNPNNPGDNPGQTGWCGDWDYTVHTYLMTPAGDTVELGRLITPYARQTAVRTPLSWKQRYSFDVTDYAPLLKNNATVRIKYSGYSGGFTADVKFAFIEGTPVREVLGVKTLWRGDFAYGNPSNPIENHIGMTPQIIAPGTQSAEMKFIITGHGFDDNDCSEFCSKNYSVLQAGTPFATRAIWRNDCGANHLYPQSGTWVFNRGNWCPGDAVQTHSYALPVTASSMVDVDFDPHNSTTTQQGTSPALYSVWGGMVYYGGFNKTVDASLDDIIAPSNHEQHYRRNPTCNTPVLRVSNAGSQAITSIHLEYGVNGNGMTPYTWNGTIAALRDTVITLPRLHDFRNLTGNANTFTVRILQVNGASDGDATNNELKSSFAAMPEWPSGFRVQFRTNNRAGETYWKIFTSDGVQVASQAGATAATTYNDTVNLLPGCYRLEVTDTACDGLSWWANQGAGTGSLTVYKIVGAGTLPLIGYFGGDFGCGFNQYFSVAGPEAIVNVPAGGDASLVVAPNPARSEIHVSLLGVWHPRGTLTAVDALGRVVHTQSLSGNEAVVDVSRWPSGLYTLTFADASGLGKVHTGVVVTH